MTTRSICVLASLLAVGCYETRPLSWRFEVPASVPASAVVVARIREGGCNDTDEVIYEARPRDTRRATLLPPLLDDGRTYCFDVAAEDPAAGCAQVARSTVAVVLMPSAPAPEVVNVLDPSHPSLLPCAAPGLCTADIGCLRCEDRDVACDGPPRCCRSAIGCDDPSSSGSACELR